MLENSVYSVASPEACASIVWRSSDMSKEAANAMKLCSQDLYDLELIDEIISEPIGGAHSNHNETALAIKTSLLKNLLNLNKMNIKDILEKRYQRLTSIGK